MKVLIVDDELAVRMYLEHVLGDLDFVSVAQADSLAAARAVLSDGDVDVVLIDLHLARSAEDGLVLVKEVRAGFRAVPIVVSGSQDHAAVRDAMKCGAWDYVIKEEIAERIVPLLRNLRQHQELEQEVRVLRARRDQPIAGLVGSSEAMQRLRADLARVAKSDKAVLVRGETGSGKELVARAIHDLSSRSAEPFLALNCSALPDALIESELFGHERGAFTGADRRKNGFFTAVQKGTLFLDEVGELRIDLQAKLLRVLEARSFLRVGSTTPEAFQGRIVAATNAQLEERVKEGSFRSDLLYRLNVLTLRVPSLDERRDDIPALVAHFLGGQERELRLSVDAVELLCRTEWRGNVRELRNLVDRLVVFCEEDDVTAASLRKALDPSPAKVPLAAFMEAILQGPDENKLDAAELLLVKEALRLSGSKSGAARLLGVNRRVIERRLGAREEEAAAPSESPRTRSQRPIPAS